MNLRQSHLRLIEVLQYAHHYSNPSHDWPQQVIARIDHVLSTVPALERLYPLIYQNAVSRGHLKWFSPENKADLKRVAFSVVADVGAKLHFIQQLIPSLEEQGLEVLLLKGMAFNHNVYSGSAPRGTSDIDILVKSSQQSEFERVLRQVATPILTDTDHPFEGLYEHSWKASQGVPHVIDVHYFITNPLVYEIEPSLIWANSQPHPAYHSESIKVLSNEMLLVNLATHVFNDVDYFNYNLLDGSMLVSQAQVDLRRCFELAKKGGMDYSLYYLLLCASYVSPRVFDSNKLQNYQPSWLRKHIIEWLLQYFYPMQVSEKSAMHRLKQMSAHFIIQKSLLSTFKLYWAFFRQKLNLGER